MLVADLFDVNIGYRPKNPLDGGGEHRAIAISDLDNDRQFIDRFPVPGPGRLWIEQLATVNLESDKETYHLKENSLLFLSRGHRRVAVPITERYVQPWPPDWPRIVALYYFFLLTPKSDAIRPEFFAWLVNDGVLRSKLDDLATGSNIPSVPKREFLTLEVPVPSIERQTQILTLYELAIQEQAFAKRLSHLRQGYVFAACQQLLEQPE